MLTGLRAWIFQRISAIYLAFYSVILFFMTLGEDFSYSKWVGMKEDVFFIASTLVAGLFLFVHCWVGIRDIILDYARGALMRLTFLALLAIALILQFIWFVLIFLG